MSTNDRTPRDRSSTGSQCQRCHWRPGQRDPHDRAEADRDHVAPGLLPPRQRHRRALGREVRGRRSAHRDHGGHLSSVGPRAQLTPPTKALGGIDFGRWQISTWDGCGGSSGPEDWSHDHSRQPHQALRGLRGGGRHLVRRRAGQGDGIPRAERRREVHDHADDGRSHASFGGHDHRPRSSLPRAQQSRTSGRRPAGRVRTARRPHRSRGAHPRRGGHGPAALTRRRDARARRPERHRGRAPGRGVLPRHAPAAGHRPCSARRAGGADPRRAGQRPRPGRNPLDAGSAPWLRPARRHGAPVLTPAARDRAASPTSSS